MFFTKSQQQVFDKLEELYKLKNSGYEDLTPITIKLYPLIAGPTGVGKSHLIRHFAEKHNLSYLHMSVGNWIPVGASEKDYTTHRIFNMTDQGYSAPDSTVRVHIKTSKQHKA